MKRELKDETPFGAFENWLEDRKAHPDEKGTERPKDRSLSFQFSLRSQGPSR